MIRAPCSLNKKIGYDRPYPGQWNPSAALLCCSTRESLRECEGYAYARGNRTSRYNSNSKLWQLRKREKWIAVRTVHTSSAPNMTHGSNVDVETARRSTRCSIISIIYCGHFYDIIQP
ncbi:unnamed protein product [Ascophyllum nodosum]